MEHHVNFCSMLLVLIFLMSSCCQSSPIGDRIDFRRTNLSSIPSVKVNETVSESITKLIFSHNAIEYLQKSDFEHFQSFPNARYLFLDNNKIQKIDGDGFWRLPNLKHIDLSHNELTRISDEVKGDLQKLPLLKYVNLKRNPIEDFGNIYELMESGVDVDFDGMSGVNKKRSLVTDSNETDNSKRYEILDDDHKNKTITDKPRKAFVRDNKQTTTVTVEQTQLDSKFLNSIVFNFVAAGLVLVALPMGMVVYYLFNKNRQLYS